MKNKILMGVSASVVAVAMAVLAADYSSRGTPSQQLGFGAIASKNAIGSIAIGSCEATTAVEAPRACQIGAGKNDLAGSFKYRNHWILDGDGCISILSYGLMRIKYSMWSEDWFEAGYLAGGAGTNAYKFSETENAGAWYLTVVDGGGDNAEVIKVMDNERNGVLIMTPNNAAADSLNAQLNGEQFTCRTNHLSAFNCRFTVDSSNAVAWVGLNLANTTAAIATPGTDYMGFYITNNGALASAIYFKAAKDSSEVSVLLGTMTSTSYYRLSLGNTDATLSVQLNGTTVTNFPITVAGVIPDDEALAPVMAIKDTTTGQASLKIDYIGMIQDRE